ncbi:tRNA 4-thiouridine(8) synthase ThiI, partial [Candidatus Woesearchaeota archaeon]|nr:tRNA 4-thiouridine(8) synthase ThiI [Candidatus Woesearchaeota archaeon]
MVLIARYGEIFLKGKNRLDFEKKLVGNIKKMFDVKVLRKRNRLLVEEGVDLRRVFGLISYSPAVEAGLDLEEIKKKVLELT